MYEPYTNSRVQPPKPLSLYKPYTNSKVHRTKVLRGDNGAGHTAPFIKGD